MSFFIILLMYSFLQRVSLNLYVLICILLLDRHAQSPNYSFSPTTHQTCIHDDHSIHLCTIPYYQNIILSVRIN